ncbi:hypothetical protein [Egicoccus halophilus]|uniref:Uncharacterized protein n=1 Tax=Egicoccus halophilus TaxID=1670830 RepID=A0A8J3EU82_9ACTN|nr:hypothetical protein [Egicoccus halophilus]GGI07157.1 hypothetical protein GCM10011354_22680 [Egicoccus halophilus]
MTDPNAEDRDVDHASGFMNRIAQGGPVATVAVVLVALLIAAWLVGLLR